MSEVRGSKQFGRNAEVEIRDFKNQTKTIIGNEFEIDFEYFKSLDQTSDDDTGRIRIFGLTPERIQSIQDGGGEVLLRCHYTEAEPVVLFHAYISRIYAEASNNTTVTTIECSANLMNFYQTGTAGSSPSIGGGGTSFKEFLYNVGVNIGAVATIINKPTQQGLTDRFLMALEEFVNQAEVNVTFVGSYQDLLVELYGVFGMAHLKKPLEKGGFILEFFFEDSALERIGREIKNGYKRVAVKNQPVPKNPSQKAQDARFATLKSSQAEDPDSRNFVLLNEQRGLISINIEYKIATAYADQELFDHEVETFKSQTAGLNEKARIARKEAKEAEKVKKAAAKGKVYVPKKSVYKTTIKVNRKYARVKALLNPNVKPQGMIAVPENVSLLKGTGEVIDLFAQQDFEDEELEGGAEVALILRVRSVKFKGNNKRGDWIMDIYSEDTSRQEQISEIGILELQRKNSSESISNEGNGEEGFDEDTDFGDEEL